MTFPRRGEVYWVNLDPTMGTEIAKTRPALVISNDVGNEYSPRMIVAPISSQGTDRAYPFQVRLQAGDAGLPRDGKVLLEQIRTVDKRRLGRRIGALSAVRMREVTDAIRVSLDV